MSHEARKWADPRSEWRAVAADPPHVADAFVHAHVRMERGDIVYVETRATEDGPVELWRVESFWPGGYTAIERAGWSEGLEEEFKKLTAARP